MQKRVGRPVDQLLKRKTLKRPRFPEINKDGASMPMEYVRLGLMWLSVVGLDLCTGIRFELFWPFIVICRLGWAAFNKDKNIMVTLANTNTSHMSMLFVCVTATADLICYLFIPLQWIIFLSCTYVWISCLWASYGGFLIALSTLTSERSKAAPLLMTTGMIIFFEYFVRQRCDITTQESDNLISIFLKGQGCDFIQSPKSLPSGLNSFFGAHCIGYPFILISMSFRYFLREWSIKRRESKVSRRNEQFVKVLTEALPATYEGPRDYSIRQPIPEEECEVLGPNFDLQPMLMAPPPTNGTNVRKISKSNGMRNRQPSKSKQNATPPAVKGARRGADEGYDEDSDDFNESDDRASSQTTVGSLFWMRPFEWLFQLLGWVFSTPSALPERAEEETQDTGIDEYKKTLRNGDLNRNRTSTTSGPRSSRRPKDKPKEKVITAQPIEREKDISLHMNGGPKAPETRDSSRDTSLSTNATSRISVSMEVERLKSDMNHLRNAEQDAKLQLVAARNTENQLRSENTNLKASMDRAENRIKTLEKQRDGNVSNMTQLEKKYAELLNKKNDVERELNAERKARKEDGGRKEQTNEQFREREREQEAMIEHLKHESVTREDRMMSIQKEMYELRKYRDSEVTEREEEIRSLKARVLDLEKSLQSENKLKQDLFRALGDARTHNAQLEDKLRTNHELAVNVHHPVSNSEKASPTQHQQQSVQQPPPYNMIMQQQSKCSDVSITSPYLYTAMHQHHSSPTGEHLLFEQSSSPSLLSNLQGTLHDPLLATRMGKFGAPANPARIN